VGGLRDCSCWVGSLVPGEVLAEVEESAALPSEVDLGAGAAAAGVGGGSGFDEPSVAEDG
jgi:hypothetical protein